MKVPKPRKLPSGNWFIQMRLNGVSVPVTASSEKECRRQAELIKAEHRAGKRSGAVLCGRDMTLREAVDKYISERTNVLSPATIRGYRTVQKHRFQSIMDTPISTIRPGSWKNIINNEAATCSPKTLKNAWGLIRSVIHDAAGAYPPDVRLPQVVPQDKLFLTPDQIKLFVSAVKDTKYAIPCLLALSSLRVSEIEALEWKDIPKKPKFIRVSGAVVPDEHHQRVRKIENKNVTSTRNVPVMIPELATALERDRKPNGPVMEMSQNTLRNAIKQICEENDLPNIGIHGLRHSFASLAYHLQMPERVAMEIGGWADTATMHKIYTHIAQSDVVRYQNVMSAFYNS